jgi:hypothetical protein
MGIPDLLSTSVSIWSRDRVVNTLEVKADTAVDGAPECRRPSAPILPPRSTATEGYGGLRRATEGYGITSTSTSYSFQRCVGSHQSEALLTRLRHEHSIEKISVMPWQLLNRGSVDGSDIKHREPEFSARPSEPWPDLTPRSTLPGTA